MNSRATGSLRRWCYPKQWRQATRRLTGPAEGHRQPPALGGGEGISPKVESGARASGSVG
jgi:hypothetical protein